MPTMLLSQKSCMHVESVSIHKAQFPPTFQQFPAEMAEWSKALDLSLCFTPDLKVFKFSRESVGSNPTFGITISFFWWVL